jgi:O-methyltransferase involved in polyketide biosynthesis
MNTHVNDVAETAFLTLYCHALDAQSKEPVLNDKSSIKTVQLLNRELSGSGKLFHKLLVSGKINKKLVVHTAIRAKKYDEYAADFISVYPEASIVNIGCGLDNRFERIDNGTVDYFDLDLPEIIDIKRNLFPETSHYHFIPQSVFDFTWMERIKTSDIMFLAEGVFMYCEAKDVKSLFLKLQSTFPGSEMVCEVFNSLWLKGWLHKILKLKMQREFHLGRDASFHGGIRRSDEIESWSEGLNLIDDWSYFDSDQKQLGWMKILRHIELFRKTQWTVHYHLGKTRLP